MKRGIKLLAAVFTCMLFTLSINVLARAGELNVALDKESCAASEAVTLNITASSDEGSTTPPQISVEYNANRLEFTSCSTEYGGGGGLITISDTAASVSFNTLSGGEAVINVTAILNDDSTDVQTASATVNVDGEDTAAAFDTTSAVTDTGVSEGSIDTGDGRVVQAVFPAEFMPALFHKSTTDYQGQTVECAQFDMGDMILLYNTDASGNDGKFMIYNRNTNELTEFRMIQGIENRYIIVLNEAEGEIPAGYTKAVLDWNGQTLTAYMDVNSASGAAESFEGVSPADFFLVYALSSEGKKGWYQYDQSEGTYQRFNNVNASGLEGGESSGALSGAKKAIFLDEYLSRNTQMIISFVLLGLTLILIIVTIVLGVKLSRSDYAYADDYYGYGDEDEEDDEEPAYVERKKSVTAANLVSEQMGDADEEEDDEEVDEEEDDYFSPRLSKKEQKALDKERKRAEKEAAKEEKWRLKEEKKAAKMKARGYEEASPMDWSSFGDEMEEDEDDRRPVGRTKLPKYMTDGEEDMEEELPDEEMEEDDDMMSVAYEGDEEEDTDEEEDDEDEDEAPKLPPRKVNPELNERIEAENAKKLKDDELRRKQKRLFEQQQQIEEARRIEEEERMAAAKREQEKFILGQQEDEDLDEDFQFEFLNLK